MKSLIKWKILATLHISILLVLCSCSNVCDAEFEDCSVPIKSKPTLPSSYGDYQMNSDDFLLWFGDQLREMNEVPIDENQRLERSQEVVLESFAILDLMSDEQRSMVLLALRDPFIGMVGNYEIPYDESGDDDWVHGILGTIDGNYD